MRTHRTLRPATAALLLAATAAPAPAADWIAAPESKAADARKAAVALQFRRDLPLSQVPRALPVEISADQRFVFYVNGQRVAAGPARGDLKAWRYEAIDLAPYLRRGPNVLAAEVWSDGRLAPGAQVTAGTTAFRLAAADPKQAVLVDTGPGWSVRVDPSRTIGAAMPMIIRAVGGSWYVAGNPETIDAAAQQPGWNLPGARAGWAAAVPALSGAAPWQMVRDQLPQMRHARVTLGKIVRSSGIGKATRPSGIVIPANSEARFLVDSGQVMAAYPVLRVSRGAGADVTLTYTEALYDPANRKGGTNGGRRRFADRARIADGEALGLTDTFKPDGRAGQVLAPFWWRGWRFVEVRVKTGAEPLRIDGIEAYATGYPFARKAHFTSSDPELDRIWQVGWQTALFDAHETYMDTAYWEQLQYIGDTRLQMLLSYAVSGDPRLAIQAIDAAGSSSQLEGIPQSAWPASGKNLIPPFALLWIGEMHDYWMRQPDTAVLTRNLSGMRTVLDWYAPYLREGGIIRPTPGWPFVDWRPGLDGRSAKDGRGPDNCVVTLQYYGALREAADLEAALGDPARAAANRAQMARVGQGLRSQCWDESRGLFADTPERKVFSQHANALAVLYDLVPAADQHAVLGRIMVPGHGIDAPAGITGTTYYFSYYLAEALAHAGMAEDYVGLLSTWRGLLRQNFTTWPEEPDPTRSDSHAWSAHPTGGLLEYVAGIGPAAPGYARVRAAPHLGPLTRLDAAAAHPAGLIETRYTLTGDRLTARIILPKGVGGTFEWRGQARPLMPGVNTISVSSAGAGSTR